MLHPLLEATIGARLDGPMDSGSETSFVILPFGFFRGYPPPPILRVNSFDSMVYEVCNDLQNLHNKGVASKFAYINNLAAGCPGLRLFF
jgi:hypothetical protein